MTQMIALNNRRFSYEDAGGSGVPVLALHGTFGRGLTFAKIAERLLPEYRLIAPDLRGHGLSEHGGGFSREDFVADAAAFIEALELAPALVIGHSLGGVTAYQLAARRPELVRAMVIEDIGAVTDESVVEHPIVDITGWPREFEDRPAIERFFRELGMPAIDYFLESAVGGKLLFDYDEMMAVQRGNAGVWWDDWTASKQPALLLRATGSFLLSERMAEEMVARRADTEVAVFGSGHWIHREAPDGYVSAVRGFFARVTSRLLAR